MYMLKDLQDTKLKKNPTKQADYTCNKNHKIFITKLLLRVLDKGILTQYMHVFDP